jgi:hypothetical protein
MKFQGTGLRPAPFSKRGAVIARACTAGKHALKLPLRYEEILFKNVQ